MKPTINALAVIVLLAAGTTYAAGKTESKSIDELFQQGKDFYHQPVSCWVCHGENAEGRVGPALESPSAGFVYEQIQNNPQMGFLAQELNLTDDDLVGVALYIRQKGVSPLLDHPLYLVF